MNIVMMTNTYLPHVGGVARSVSAFAEEYRRRGHNVLVIAPVFKGAPRDEPGVIRVPAIQNFNASDFSVRVALPGLLTAALDRFGPDIIHSHHPFMLGDAALRAAGARNLPLVFTHHTMYERYTHYIPGDSPALKRFAMQLASAYAQQCDHVIAPSPSIAAILRERGVTVPITPIPTGIRLDRFAAGDGTRLRRSLGIPAAAFVIGHVGRLAPEKNLEFLARASAAYIKRAPGAHLLIVGSGPSTGRIREIFDRARLSSRLTLAGTLEGRDLADAYHAADVFAFASTSETQGMVLAEAMAAGLPVVALDAPGVREVVRDGVNGRLLHRQSIHDFAQALREMADVGPQRRRQLRDEARKTAAEFSLDRCAGAALAVYESAIITGPRRRHDDSPLDAILRSLEAEWKVWATKAGAMAEAVSTSPLWRPPAMVRFERRLRLLRRRLSRSEWFVRLLGLTRSGGHGAHGLIMLQIDGLSRAQLDSALRRGGLPFLASLLDREHYRLRTMYSGLPSSTPAVQGELFYGVRCAVPAFSFRDKAAGRIVRMFDAEAVVRRQARLATHSPGLLEGGSAYADVYSGGAAEARFCASTIGPGAMLRSVSPAVLALMLTTYLPSLLRLAGLLIVETALALTDFTRGVFGGERFRAELKFIPARVAICIALRELVVIGVQIDAARGLPVIHANFLGYDEQAHRRGPDSAFAHWTLLGIDRAIERIVSAARRSARRDYRVWVYSDHGQERTIPYPILTGSTLQHAVLRAFRQCPPPQRQLPGERSGERSMRAKFLGGRFLKWLGGHPRPPQPEPRASGRVIVTAMGPLAHVYPPEPLADSRKAALARDLASNHRIPTVLAVLSDGAVRAWTRDGEYILPGDAPALFGPDHPFLGELAEDFERLCRHEEAGELVLSGFKAGDPAVSFPFENGAHAGPGPDETGGFVLAPAEAPLPHSESFIRPADLRRAALIELDRAPPPPTPSITVRERAPAGTGRERAIIGLRVMTYNAHACLGMDAVRSIPRIARVIARHQPDVVALQELDVGRARSGTTDQALAIARALEMDFHFHPALRIEEEQYGDAVLSRYPMKLVRAGPLPGRPGRLRPEPRGALWVAIDLGQRRALGLINTHLGLFPREREAQVCALLGPEWLGHPDCASPVVLCGDFNATPRSAVWRRICTRLRDVQSALEGHAPRGTWFGRYPFTRIDHIFVDEAVTITAILVPRDHLTRTASDHLPLIVDLQIAIPSSQPETAAPQPRPREMHLDERTEPRREMQGL